MILRNRFLLKEGAGFCTLLVSFIAKVLFKC